MKTFYFNTGVRQGIPENERHIKGARPVPLCDGQVWRNGTKQIPFDCEDVPENATFLYASPYNNIPSGDNVIIRKIHNSTMCGEFAYFSV